MISNRVLVDLFRLSRREYFADFFITPPVTIVSLVLSILYGFTAWWPVLFAAGVLFWTLYEYLLHRFVLHRLWLFRAVHAAHHDQQKDYIGTHPALTIAIYAALWILLGVGNASAAMVGFSAGYVAYSALHTLFHYARIRPGSRLWRAKRRHALHHWLDDVNYGVSTALWDRAFGTYRAP
jgi:sterol desaturase/sphingolipid hydroxylase (fatty acid hydroxylase superfamily)